MQSRRLGASLFIISIVLAGALGFGFGLSSNHRIDMQGGATVMTTSQQSASTNEQLTLERFDFTNLTMVRITILNTGGSPTTISRVHFGSVDVTPGSYVNCIANLVNSKNVPLTAPMQSQTECSLSFAVSGVMPGSTYPVAILTSSGGKFVFSIPAGGSNIGM